MRGFPKHIATKADLEIVQEMFPVEAAAYVKNLEEGRFIWEQSKVLAKGEIGKTSETEKVIETGDATGKPIQVQLVKVEDQNSQFVKLGLAPKVVNIEVVG